MNKNEKRKEVILQILFKLSIILGDVIDFLLYHHYHVNNNWFSIFLTMIVGTLIGSIIMSGIVSIVIHDQEEL